MSSIYSGREPRLFRWLSAIEAAAGVILVITVFGLVFIQAVQRYLPVSGWVWSGELARYGLVGLTFVMCGYLMGKGTHITITVIDKYVHERVRQWIRIFAHVVVTLICIGFIREGYALVTSASGQVSPAMQMPMTFLYVIPFVGFVLTALRSVYAIIRPAPVTDKNQEVLEGGRAV